MSSWPRSEGIDQSERQHAPLQRARACLPGAAMSGHHGAPGLPRGATAPASVPAGEAPFFSLILATWERSEPIGRLLSSLQAQEERSFELLVVDQNADERIATHLGRLAEGSERIAWRRLRQSEPNLSVARNTGLAQARGEFVAFPDDDCWYEVDTLAQVRNYLANTPGIDGVVACWTDICPTDADTAPRRLRLEEWRRFRGGDASSITLFLRRSRIEAIGGFEPRLGIGRWYGAGEETDLLLRLLADDAEIHMLPSARVRHLPPDCAAPLSLQRWQARRQRERAVGALYIKHGLAPLIIARGLLAPPTTRLFSGKSGSLVQRLALGLASSLGRLEGMLGWLRDERRRRQR